MAFRDDSFHPPPGLDPPGTVSDRREDDHLPDCLDVDSLVLKCVHLRWAPPPVGRSWQRDLAEKDGERAHRQGGAQR